MQRYEVQGAWGLDHLTLAEHPSAPVGPGEVRIALKAVALNYRDWLMVEGLYDPRLPLPMVPCSDGVGVVVELGEGVRTLEVGDRVVGTFSPSWIAGAPDADAVRLTRGGVIPGMLSQEAVEREHALVKVPAFLSDTEAATLPCAGLTAWSALAELGSVRAGQTVLTLGSGGVSVFALQLAKLMGARVICTTSSPQKAQRLRELGADHVVLYPQDPRWGRTIRRWSGGGVDQVIEVGGAGTLAQSLDAVRPGGTVSLIGVLSGVREPLLILPVLMKQIRVQGVLVGHRRGLEALCRAVESAALRPVIDRVFGWTEAPDALRYLKRGDHVGKVCVEI